MSADPLGPDLKPTGMSADPVGPDLKPTGMSADLLGPDLLDLTRAISAAMVELYATSHPCGLTTATTYINDNVVVCVLETFPGDEALIDDGGDRGNDRAEPIDGSLAFQTETEDAFTCAIERLTKRRVVAFLGADRTAPGVACELFFLDGAVLSLVGSGPR